MFYKIFLIVFLIVVVNLNAFDNEKQNNSDPGEYINLLNSPFEDNGNVDGSDSDWQDSYYFKVAKDGDVTITLSSNTDLDFKIDTKYNGQDIKRDISFANIKTFTFSAQANTNYYLTLFDNEWRDQPNPYTLKIEFPSDSSLESNDGKVIKVYAHYEDATPSDFTANYFHYFWGVDKNLVIDGFEYNGKRYNYTNSNAIVKIRRSDNSSASGEPCGLFAEKDKDAYHIKPSYPQGCDMAKVMSGRVINVGALDLFKNTDETAKNIERVDFITPNGITAPINPDDLVKAGHVVTEKSGNNELKIAAILSLDANGNPSSFGPLVDIHGGGEKDYGIVTIYLPDGSTVLKQSLGFYRNEKSAPQGDPWYVTKSYEAMGMCFVTLKDLGISAGQKYYGFAYFGRDVTDSMDLVKYDSFPKNTGGDTADPYGGVASYFAEESLLVPFSCSKEAYLFTGVSTSDAYTLDLSNGSYELAKQEIQSRINATGYNIKDNFIWGYDINSHKVIKIDAKYNIVSYDIAQLPDASYYAGDVSKDGILYLKTHNDLKIYKIDLNDETPKYDGYISLVKNLNFGDFAFNPIDDMLYSISETDSHLYRINPSNGSVTDLGDTSIPTEFHTFVFDKVGNLYFYGSEGKIYKIDLGANSSAPYKVELFATTDIKKAGGDGARCPQADVIQPTEGICYAISDVKKKIYKVYMSPGADPLPLASKIDIVGTNDIMDGEAEAYNSADGLIYAFNENSSDPKLYSIDPSNGEATYITSFDKMKENVVGASFYGGYLYVIAKEYDGDATLYKIDTTNWSIVSSKNINGDTTDADALAINGSGEAYTILDDEKKIYSFDIETAKTKFKVKISTNTDAEALSFAKDGNLYVENSEDQETSDTDKIFKVNLDTGELTAAAQIPHEDDIDIEGMSCNVVVPSTPTESENICYAIDPYSDYLYTTKLNPGASSLPQATRKALDFSSVPILYRDSLDGQSQAYNPKDGLIYRFREEDMYFYSIDPETAKVTYIKTFSGLKEWIVGASFYGDYLYVIAKHIDESTLYKIETSNWTIVSQVDVKDNNNRYVDVDSLAINSEGKAYITDFRENETVKHLFSLDLATGKAQEIYDLSNPIDLEGLSFAKDDNLYISNSAAGTNKDDNIISMLNLDDGSRVAAAHVPESFDAHINGLSCNIKNAVSTQNPNAMLLTRGDGNDNDKTNIYVFNIDTDTDTITNFHLLKKLDKKFRALTYKDGSFYTSDMQGNIYTIDINTGNYTLDTSFGKIDSTAIMGMDFDNDDNILYSIWNSSLSEQRKLRKYNPSTGTSTVVTSVPTSDDYIDYAIAYFGNDKTVVSVGSGAVRFINGSTIGDHITSSEWCVYGGEYVKDDKGYFINAESDDLSVYKLDGNSWNKIYTYGTYTSGNKGEAIAIVHEKPKSSTPLPNVTISDVSKYEGDSGTTEYKVTVTLDQPAQTDLTLTYSTEDGTAKTSDSDYQSLFGTKTISKGTSSFVIKVYANGDKKVEDDEYFYLNIKLTN